MAVAGVGSQVLLFALTVSLFDHLDGWCTASELARALRLNALGLGEVLECLVSMGLLECGPRGYRNLELAARYLRDDAPQTLKPAVLALAAHQAPLTSVGRYVMNGRPDGGSRPTPALCACRPPSALPATPPAGARPARVAARGRVLLVGWGGEAYRELISARWPEMELVLRNPFCEEGAGDLAATVAEAGGHSTRSCSPACCPAAGGIASSPPLRAP